MVRSLWMGPVFGVLALTGLAWGQTTSSVPAMVSEVRERYFTVREADKPAQRCKVLKTWNEADGVRAFQVQALDTGELMTIEETARAAAPPGGLVRSAGMRIFHWGYGPLPTGTPEPPPNAVVVGYAIDIRPTPPDAAHGAVAPLPAPQKHDEWPSAFEAVSPDDLGAARPVAPPAPLKPPAAKKVEPTPLPAMPVAASPVKVTPVAAAPVPAPELKPAAAAPPVTVWTPFPAKPADAAVAKPAAELKPALPVVAKAPAELKTALPAVAKNAADVKPTSPAAASPYAMTPAPAKANIDKAAPAVAAPKATDVATKVETTPAKAGDWRQSWGNVDPPPLVTPKAEPPHAAPKADDPLKSPQKYAKVPGDASAEKPAPDKKAPTLAKLATDSPPPAVKVDKKDLEMHTLSPLPAVPGPTTAAADAAPKVLSPIAVAPKSLSPAATAPKSASPEAAAPKPPAAPLGMASVLAAGSPELAPPAAAHPAPAASQDKAAMSLSADAPNAFSGGPPSRSGMAANAFSAPAPAPQADALATNAFPAPQPAQPAARTPAPTMQAGNQAPTGYVVPAGYRQDSGYALPQLTGILHDSLFPSQREWAAETLASMDWRRQPQIVDVLVNGAKEDPAPSVRAECLRSLGRMKVDAPAAMECVKALKSDADAHVRQAAEEAYGEMTDGR